MTRYPALVLIAAVLLLAIPAVFSQPAPTPAPISGHFSLAAGVYEIDCLNGQPPTLVPPNVAICPVDGPTPTHTPTTTPTPTSTPTAAPATPGAFIERFDGTPPSPEPWRPSDWDVTVHSRDRETWYELELMAAQHGSDCQPPPDSHIINTYEEAVFRCNDHIMTAIRASGYGVIYLTPNQLVDFSEGEAVIRFDVSTLRTSHRDWIDLWITPYEDNLQTPLEDWLPDLNGEPRNAVHIRMKFGSAGNLTGVFEGFIIRGFDDEEIEQSRTTGYETLIDPSSTARQTFELRISQTHIKFGMPAPGIDLWWIDTDIEPLDWNQGIVQFGHHSYNPTKGCPICLPNTWHWDNASIDPAVPFTLIRADRRYVDPTQPGALTFPQPAPANAYLRFSGIGSEFEISTDNSQTWQPAVLQAQEEYHEDHFRTYWTPIPAGTQSVLIRCEKWWGGNCMARDISIWAR